MVLDDIKPLVKGRAFLQFVESGGIATYLIVATDDSQWEIKIDLSNKSDVGDSAKFLPTYDKAITLMRWIRKANEKDELTKII